MTLSRGGARCIAWAAIAAVVLWVVWGLQPPSVVPVTPDWVDVYVPLAVFGALFPLTALALRQEKVGAAVGGTALVAVTGALIVQALTVFVYLTAFRNS